MHSDDGISTMRGEGLRTLIEGVWERNGAADERGICLRVIAHNCQDAFYVDAHNENTE